MFIEFNGARFFLDVEGAGLIRDGPQMLRRECRLVPRMIEAGTAMQGNERRLGTLADVGKSVKPPALMMA
jgi:hypothetical protein